MNASKNSEQRQKNPILESNFISKWFFWWTRETFKNGMRENLTENNLYEQIPTLESENISTKFFQYWQTKDSRKRSSLLSTIFRVYGWRIIPVCFLYSILEVSIHASQPIFLGGLVSYFSEGQIETSKRHAYLYATGVVLSSLASTLCLHPFMFFLFERGTQIRLACSGLIYRKCLSSSVSADKNGMGALAVAVIASDLTQFNVSLYFLHELWKGPLEACIFGYIMYRNIGWPAVVGIMAIVTMTPLQAWAAMKAVYFKRQSTEYGDDRVRLMNEIITAIQVIKMYAWEKCFAKLISVIRKKEIKAIRGITNIYAALKCTNIISKFAVFVSLVYYVYSGDILTAKLVFVMSSYYEALSVSLLKHWPHAIITWAETIVCARRVVNFLHNLDRVNYDGAAKMHNSRVHTEEASVLRHIVFKNISVKWHKTDPSNCVSPLYNVSFHIKENQFVGIIGNIGSGKTTLLHTLLGELEISQGCIEINGLISYAAQDAWIFEGSIRENIIFVDEFDVQRYKSVLEVCELGRDLELFAFGDSTIIGEHGISLSGGQKSRINLARAIYRKADIYIFDDPLSAVDCHVGKRLVQKCFMTFLKEKIRVLVTQHVQHLQQADQIFHMSSGQIEIFDTYEGILNMTSTNSQELEDNASIDSQCAFDHTDGIVDDSSVCEVQKSNSKDNGLNRKEQQIQGAVTFDTYMSYLSMLQKPWLIMVIPLLFILARGCQAAMDVLVSKWATWEESIPMKYESADEYMTKREEIVLLYTILLICSLLLHIFRTFGFFTICLKIALRLHEILFNGIIRARMHFFTNNTSGRILNRFASDIANIDVELPKAMFEAITFYIDVIAVLIIVATSNYWLIIPAVLMISLMLIFRSLFIGASRSLKRIESMTRSPIYSHLSQTFHGLTTIRALKVTHQMEKEFHCHQNKNTSALYLYVSVNRAFALWTDLVCVLYMLVVTFSFLFVNRKFYSGDVGLAITQSMTLVYMCQWGMRQTAEMEANMTSFERIMEYIKVTSEPSLETHESLHLPSDWPSNGCLNFLDVQLRYSEYGKIVLKNLNLSIKPMEKIGIVGRTGAGKSSIVQAIFRLALIEGGIYIDGFDISQLGLHDLRNRISIIPQDSVIFSGTLRYNLDPFDEKTDGEIWKALEDVKLKDFVESRVEGGLSCPLTGGGSNFSMGQRQLICLARAILRHNKILIMDEPTVHVNAETDKLIQEAIHIKFKMCTVLTITHRLYTVMDNDRVIVMDGGRIVELGHPFELLQNQNGYLYALVQKTGCVTAEHLLRLAMESYAKRVLCKRTT